VSNRSAETNAAINDPDFLDDLCAEIASGGTLVRVCKERNLVYRLVNRWIQSDEDRAKRYKDTLIVREHHAKDEVIAELLAWIRADATQAFTPEGALLPLSEFPEDLRKLVAGFEVEALYAGRGEERAQVGTLTKVKFWDKPRSLETLARHLAMLVDRKEVDTRMTLADLLNNTPTAKQ
jgi:hypothetical protein